MEEQTHNTVSIDKCAVLDVLDEGEDEDVDHGGEEGYDHVTEEGGVDRVGDFDPFVHLESKLCDIIRL